MKTFAILVSAVVIFFTTGARAGEILSPFSGSETVGAYQADFVKFYYLVGEGDSVETVRQDGRLISRIYLRPAEKSNYEVFKSYEKELTAAGFDMLAVLDNVAKAELLARSANGKEGNNFLQRAYEQDGKAVGVGVKGAVATQGQEYIAARRTIDGTDVLIVVNLSRNGHYVIEQFETAAMEEGTVALTLDALNSALDTDGRIAIYGIHFDTGSAVIKPESAETVGTIVQYLSDHPDRIFYVVGHTDDQGELAANLTLSEARARAVVDAVTTDLPDAAPRLIARGVGPLSPVATNGAADGRQLNRRVELVSTHP